MILIPLVELLYGTCAEFQAGKSLLIYVQDLTVNILIPARVTGITFSIVKEKWRPFLIDLPQTELTTFTQQSTIDMRPARKVVVLAGTQSDVNLSVSSNLGSSTQLYCSATITGVRHDTVGDSHDLQHSK